MFSKKKTYYDRTDEDLMACVQKRDEQAFGELYDRYADRMYRYFYRMLQQDSDLSNDQVQDLFVKVIEKADLYDPKRKFSTWLYAVAGNMCKNIYRSRQRKAPPEPLSDQPIPDASDPHPYLPDGYDRELFDRAFQQALNKLNPDYLQCYILRYQQDLSIKEIAAICDCSEGTIKSRLFHIVRKLSKQLRAFQICPSKSVCHESK